MAHVGQKLALGAIGRLGGHHGLRQPFFRLLSLGVLPDDHLNRLLGLVGKGGRGHLHVDDRPIETDHLLLDRQGGSVLRPFLNALGRDLVAVHEKKVRDGPSK